MSGTVRAYSAAVNRFKRFCTEKSFPFPDFSSDILMQYVLHLDSISAPFSAFKSLKPALTYFVRASGLSDPFTPAIDLIISGAERRISAVSGPVRKAAVLPTADISAVFDKLLSSDSASFLSINAIHFRTLFRIIIVFHTLCRLDCFRKLRACHFELDGPDVIVTFPSAKNGQLHRGRKSALVHTDSPYCPVRITVAFFRRFGLRFGAAAAESSLVNFQLRQESASLLPIRSKSLSATSATADLRSLLARVGFSEDRLTDKSVKMAGVTAAYEAGATCEDVMHAGRWRTTDIPLRYKTNSNPFKRAVAAKIPSIRPS